MFDWIGECLCVGFSFGVGVDVGWCGLGVLLLLGR